MEKVSRKFYGWRARYGKVNEYLCSILDGYSRFLLIGIFGNR